MECPNCGAENSEDASYCGLCYKRLGEEPTPEEAPVVRPLEAIPGVKPAWNRKRKNSHVLGLTVLCVIAVVVVVVLVFVTRGQKEEGPEPLKEYRSTVSGLNFKYPESWEKQNRSFLSKVQKGGDTDPSMGNEIILMKRGETIYRHLLVASSRPFDQGGMKWSELEESMKEGLADSASGEGVEVGFFNINLPAASGTNGFAMSYIYDPPTGPDFYQLEAYVVRGDEMYNIRFITPLKGGGSDEVDARSQFDQIMSTVQIGG